MKSIKAFKTICIYLCLLGTLSSYSQNRIIKKGNKEYDRYAFINSREYYLELAAKDSVPKELLERLGDSYYFNADYINAAKWYQRLVVDYKQPKPEYLYRYALSVKTTGNYHVSDSLMNAFYIVKGDDYRARLFDKQRNYLKEIEQQSDRFSIKLSNFNSPVSDFAPTFYGDSLVFSSNRDKVSLEKNIHLWNNQAFLDLYMIPHLKNDGYKVFVKKFDKTINTKYHESTAVFTKDLKTVYFTRNNYFNNEYKKDSQGVNLLKLFRANMKNGSWEITELPFNSNEYSVAHPALSSDEKTLYFSSDMPGGFGQADMYKVEIMGEQYGEPENLGSVINTEGRETFPFISKDNKLYFASDGHVGLGGLDLFVTEITTDEKPGEPYNLGSPANSKYDDITLIIDSDTRKGYFSSNRDAEPYNDDIYELIQTRDIISKCIQFVKGIVKDLKTGEPIPTAAISLYDTENKLVSTTTSSNNGTFSFDNELICQKNYSLRIEKATYLPKEEVITLSKQPEGVINVEIPLEKETFIKNTDLARIINLLPIKFEFDKDKIVAESEKELNKVIEVMQSFPDMIIEVRSHTDNRGTLEYNRVLSEKRAIATVKYIVEKGNIDPNRISGKGYGEDKPIYDCDKNSCTEEQYHANRRSEFIIK